MSKKLLHAKHNEKVFDYLFKEIDFIDWMITTAFYTSIHLVDNKVFPLTKSVNGKPYTFKELDEYFSWYKYNNPTSRESKHEVRRNLVFELLKNDAPADFKWLKDTCFTARYVDYVFEQPQLMKVKAKTCLESIKKETKK